MGRAGNAPAWLCVGTWLLAGGAATAADWPQWRGPLRNGVSTEPLPLDQWAPQAGPPVLWRAAVGRGHSAISVADGRAFTLGWDGSQDTVWCFDASDGTLIWKRSYDSGDIKQWPGPRATPTISGGRVFTLGLHGDLACWDARDGRPIWNVQLAASYNPDVDYGMAWSPLPCGELLLFAAGARGLAIRADDGSYAWGNDGQHGACASPVPYDQAGRPGVALVLTNPGRDSASLVGVNPLTGEEFWRYGEWPEKWGAICVDPIVSGGHVFVTSAETHLQGTRFSIRDGTLVEDWSNNKLTIYTGGCVLLDGFLYGIHKSGILRCLDWERGEERWAQRGFGEHGSLIAADGKLLVQTYRSGELVVIDAAPAAYRELRRVKVFDGDPTSFTPPVLAHGRIYCRSYDGEVVCLAAAPAPPTAAPAAAATRIWTDDTGRHRLEASLVAVEGDRVRLRKVSGAEIVVPLSRLSREDRLLLKRRATGASPP